MLEVFGELLDQFDAAVKLGADGRAKHTTATKQIRSLAVEAGQLVRSMDARNRHRFKNDGQALGEWIAASTIVGKAALPATSGPADEEGRTPDPGGDVRPAA